MENSFRPSHRNSASAQELFMALRHFLDEHPEARAGVEVRCATHK
jgi:hypothetical protein